MTIRNRLLAAAVAGTLLTVGAPAFPEVASADPEPAPSPAPSGIWQAHKLTFNYMGFTSIYTCEGLADKLRLLLRLTGAGPDFKVSEVCARGFDRPDRLAMADLTFSSLQPDAPNPVAAGTWQHVDLSPNHPFDLGRGDCELIEEFRDRVLPMFAVRNIVNNVTCIPYQDTGTDFHLSFDVFAPLKPPKAEKIKKS
jgi:hypothetical protein